VNRVIRSFRLQKVIDDKLAKISKKTGETKTHVLESLLEYALKAYEKENK
jgi:predicted DNA-binding protein